MGHAEVWASSGLQSPSQGLRSSRQEARDEGIEAALGSVGPSLLWASPLSSLCPQNAERLLENIGIKVG